MTSQTNEQALEAVIEKKLTGTTVEELKATGGNANVSDRVEIYRPLRVDPKEARRQRFTGQGAKAAGLFQNRRKGAKAGY